MDFKSYLEKTAIEINRELEKILKDWSLEVGNISPKLIDLNNTFIDASGGGKRLRGMLVQLGYQLTGATPTMEILKPAAAFEIFQTAILAHDDIIDLSPLRRGKPTLYKALGGDHYAISQALCLGDIGFFLSYKLISESGFGETERNLAIQFFAKLMLDTCLGELLDVELPHQNGEKTQEDIVTIFHLKTAMYTITGPLSLGAILGGGDEKLLENIADFGHNLGVAYQIQDDILGVFGSEETIGKSVTSDIEEGKLTLLFLYALERADNKQKEILDEYYGKGRIGNEELEKIRQVFKETGALEYSQNKALELVEKAKKIISEMQILDDKKELLLQMADFLVNRQK